MGLSVAGLLGASIGVSFHYKISADVLVGFGNPDMFLNYYIKPWVFLKKSKKYN
jgi:hypothetical protein